MRLAMALPTAGGVRTGLNPKRPARRSKAGSQPKGADLTSVMRSSRITWIPEHSPCFFPTPGKMAENETMSLTQAIALAGGWDKMAALSSARILRADGGQTREQIPANVKEIMENKAPDLQMRPDDIL
jgi:hypothetical protein